jgi:tetratricopeptide (TPR) repeat protein
VKYLTLLITLVTFGALLAIAEAQPSEVAPAGDDVTGRAKSEYEAASRHYDLREYAAAIASFRKAYELLPEPLFLFDIAQSYRQLHDCESARGFYKTYLRNLPTADNRAKVEAFITEMDECVRAQPSHVVDAPTLAPAAPAASVAQVAPVAPVAPVARPTSRLQIASIVVGLTGVAIAGVGIYFSSDAADQAHQVELLCAGGCAAADVAELDRAGHDANRNAILSYAVGGTAIAAGITMLLWSTLHTDEVITLTPTPHGATVGAAVRF